MKTNLVNIDIVNEISKITKVIYGRTIVDKNSLDELIGIVKLTKPVDIERLLNEKGFEDDTDF